MKRAVFLDRDGTIIEDDGYISDVARIHVFPWSAKAITRLREAGFLIVVVTNQAGVARGFFDEAFIAEAHRHLDALLAAQVGGSTRIITVHTTRMALSPPTRVPVTAGSRPPA